MSLSKAQMEAHARAKALVARGELSMVEREFVLEHYQAGAEHLNKLAGAHFTPPLLAFHLAQEVGGRRIIDLGAGIGRLAFAIYRSAPAEAKPEIVCVERNPDYLAVGRAVLPEAAWVEADVFDLPELGQFDCVVSNPPFGRSRGWRGLHARTLEHGFIEIGARLAPYGVFILPQMSCGFRVSGSPGLRTSPSPVVEAFRRDAGIEIEPTSIDTTVVAAHDPWTGVTPVTEIVTVDYRLARAQLAAGQGALALGEARHQEAA